MAQRVEVIVVGMGAMGSAACLELARRGVRVLGLEQFGIPHMMGSSHGDSRMIRLCYYEHPDYVPLLHRAYERWFELERLADTKLLHMTGGLYMGPPESEFVSGTLRAAREHQLPHEVLNRGQLRDRFGQFHLPDDHIGIFEPNAGFLTPERIIAACTEMALRHGARVHAHETVLDWRSDGDGIRVSTNTSEYRCDRIIFCGGAWTGKLLDEVGVYLKVTRQPVGWVWPKRPEDFALGTMPVWGIGNADGSLHYGFPMLPNAIASRPGFKIAHHFDGQPTNPEDIDRTPRPEDEDDFRSVLQRFLPDADGPLLSMSICMYTVTPDSHFIIDRNPRDDRVLIACGFSGHGFKFASVVGEALADMAMDGRTSLPIGFLNLRRFAATNAR